MEPDVVLETLRDAWRDRRRYWKRWGIVRGSWARHQLRPLKQAAPGTLTPFRVPGVSWPILARAATSDEWAYEQIFLQAELDVRLPAEPATIIDAGANVGYASLWFAARYPAARIISLEIDQANAAVLRRNVEPLSGRVTVRPQGLWGRRTRLAIENPDAASWSFRAVESPTGAIEAVGVHDLLDELGLERLGLLKLDIEGGELEVLEGAPQWIDRVDAVMVELHDRYRPGCTEALARVVSRWGLSVTTSGDYHVVTR